MAPTRQPECPFHKRIGENVTGDLKIPDEDSGPATPHETARYMFEMLSGLSIVARNANMMFLAYLLEIAGSEAARLAQSDSDSGAGKS